MPLLLLLLLLCVECERECNEQPRVCVCVRGLARVMGDPAASVRLEYVETQSKHSVAFTEWPGITSVPRGLL